MKIRYRIGSLKPAVMVIVFCQFVTSVQAGRVVEFLLSLVFFQQALFSISVFLSVSVSLFKFFFEGEKGTAALC